MNPIVSIISVTYQAEQFLEKTMFSILNQDCSDFEYLIIDGNSTDKTTEIIKLFETQIKEGIYAINPSNFHWISEPDKGLYDAMNKGLRMAKGKYLWFINAGDKIHSPTTLKEVTQLIKQHSKTDIIYGQSLMIDRNDNPLGERHKIAPKHLTKKSLLKGLVVCHQSILVNKGIAPLYDLNYKIAADYDWVVRVLSLSKQNTYINDYLSDFMIAGTSSLHRKQALKERFLIMKKHFGLCRTLWAHLIIVLKYPFTRKY
ncbi:MAG: glycosyltransferase [Bacteroidales bacterium]|jgi:glycosyltransferase involved in cell wall biosynthesis|nr:glycosyltransferase [Bacteroidales bacterium]